MDSDRSFQDFLRLLAKELGVETIPIDENDTCSIVFDDISVCIGKRKDGDSIVIYSPLGEVQEHLKTQVLSQAMAANLYWRHTGGGTLGYENSSANLILCLHVFLCHEFEDFLRMLEDFVNHSSIWSKWLENLDDYAREDEESLIQPIDWNKMV